MNYIRVGGKLFLQFVKAAKLARHTDNYNVTMFLDPSSDVDEPEAYIQWTPRITFFIREDYYDIQRNNRSAPA